MNGDSPAFPQTYRIRGDSTIVGATGITIRDYFAAAALPAILAENGRCGVDQSTEEDCLNAYYVADAMLVARGKRS